MWMQSICTWVIWKIGKGTPNKLQVWCDLSNELEVNFCNNGMFLNETEEESKKRKESRIYLVPRNVENITF